MTKTEQLEVLFDEWQKAQIIETDEFWRLTNGGNSNITRAHFQKDGIIDEELFEREARKILFISNEANNNEYSASSVTVSDARELYRSYNETGIDDWSGKMRERTSALYKVIAGIDKDDMENSEAAIHYAIMDLNKRGGGANCKGGNHIVEYCRIYKEFIKRELEIINPDIVIWLGGSVYDKVMRLLGMSLGKGGGYLKIGSRNIPAIKMWHTSHYRIPKDFKPLPGYEDNLIIGKQCTKLMELMEKYGLNTLAGKEKDNGSLAQGRKGMTEITISTSPVFQTIVEAINTCFSKKYKGWYKSYFWPTKTHDVFIWFPKIAEPKGDSFVAPKRSQGWINVISQDGTVLTEENVDDVRPSIEDDDLVDRVTFGWYEGLGYKFIGVFRLAPEECRPKHRVYKRVSDKVDFSSINSR